MSNNNGVNISDLENKIKHYQDENIRISSELVESDKRFAVTRDSLSALQDQRSNLIEKLNSINNVMKGENIISNVFDESTDKTNTNQTPKKNTSTGNLDKQIQIQQAKLFCFVSGICGPRYSILSSRGSLLL